MPKIAIILCCLLMIGTAHIPIKAAEPEKIRATYSWIKPLELGEQQLTMLKDHGLNTALIKDGRYELRKELWHGWGQMTGQKGIQLFAVFNFVNKTELETMQGQYRPYVNHRGHIYSNTPCPLDEQYWDVIIRQRFARMAEISKKTDIAGLIFDTEMYAAETRIYKDLCLCDLCWDTFRQHSQHDVPKLHAKQRHAFLQERQLFETYRTFQTERLQGILRKIEQQLHLINPALSLGFLFYRENWFYQGLIRGLGTSDKPILVFSENSYIYGYTPNMLKEQKTLHRSTAASSLIARYIPGLWLSRFFPEDIGSHCAYLTRDTDGYWLYTAQSLWPEPAVKSDPLHGTPADYWQALKQANGHDVIKSSSLPPIYPTSFYDSAQKRLTVPPSVENFLKNIVSHFLGGQTQHPSKIRYRRKTLFHFLNINEGTVQIIHKPLGKYTDPTRYTLFDNSGQVIRQGKLDKHHSTETLSLPHEGSELFSLLIDSGSNTAYVSFTNVLAVVEASSTFPLATNNTAESYAVYVKPENRHLRLRAFCSGGEFALISIQSPENAVQYTTEVEGLTEVSAPVLEEAALPQTGTFWTIDIQPVPSKTFDDIKFSLYNDEYPYIVVSP